MGQGQGDGKAEKKGDIVIVRVDMDCEACKQKVRKVLKNFPGVENVDLNMDEQKVTIKGNVDAWKVYEALKKKCGKRTMLVYPQFTKEEERKAKEDSIINSVNKIVDSITDLLTPKPPNTVVELKVRMHCGACAKKIKKVLLRLDEVTEVEGDMATDKVVVKGRDLDAEALCQSVKQSGKPCELISFKKEEKAQEKKGEKKEDNKAEKKKKDEKAEGKEEKKDEGKKKEGKKAEDKELNKGENKGAKKGENKGGDKGEKKAENKEEKQEEKNDKNTEDNKPEKDSMKGGKNGSKNEKKDDKSVNEGELEELEIKKFMYTPYQSVPEYAYAPQIFSDENPNACSIM